MQNTNFKQQLKQAYDSDAKRRDSNEETRDQWKLDLREEFINLLKSENKKTILELGAGAGIDSKYFMDQGFDIFATDLSEEMVKMCQKRGLKAKTVDLYNLNTLNQTFDAIFSLNVLLHVPKKDLTEVLNGIYEVLNTTGVFFYGVYGGVDEEKTIVDEKRGISSRFFSFLSDDNLKKVVSDKFEIIKFHTIDIGSKTPRFHFQSLFLRKK